MLVEYHVHNHLPCLDPWSSKWDGIVWLHSLERHTATSTQSFSKQWKAHFEALGQRPNSWGQGQGGESGQSFSISCHLCLTPHTNCGDDCMIVQVMTILGVHTSQQKLAPAVFHMVSRLVGAQRSYKTSGSFFIIWKCLDKSDRPKTPSTSFTSGQVRRHNLHDCPLCLALAL